MNRAYYAASIFEFLQTDDMSLLGHLSLNHAFALEESQKNAWLVQIEILKAALQSTSDGFIYLEYAIPRMGRRIDAVLLIGPVIFVLEFKIGETDFSAHAIDQVWDYALDLKNFHEASHECFVAPILIADKAKAPTSVVAATPKDDRLLTPIRSNAAGLRDTIDVVLNFAEGTAINPQQWEQGRYHPTPTIIEAAMALYNGHSVGEISRSDASAINLRETSDAISQIIRLSKAEGHKSLCFVTGVPGAGKTLVGLNIATTHIDKNNDLYSVFLSGNGPLVAILREALARDKVRHEREQGRVFRKGAAMSDVKLFIQNVHNFRDECLVDFDKPPIEHVALFDEAQRAWDLQQTAAFMHRKRKKPGFSMSEPEFLISCLDRHPDWAVVVCLVGGGQEINTGEAGIGEWIAALNRSFPNWHIYISPRLSDSEYEAGRMLEALKARPNLVGRQG